MTYHVFIAKVTQRMPHMEQELPTLPKHLSFVRVLVGFVLFMLSYVFTFLVPYSNTISISYDVCVV